MIEAEATCERNMSSEIKIAIKCNTKITYSVWWCDATTKDVRREEMSKFGSLSECTYNYECMYVHVFLFMYTYRAIFVHVPHLNNYIHP